MPRITLPSGTKRRVVLLSAGVGVLLFAFLFMTGSGGDTGSAPANGSTAAGDKAFEVGIPTLQKVEAFVQGYGSRVESTESELARLRKELGETEKRLQESIAQLSKARQEETGLLKSMLQGGQDPSGSGARPPAGAARIRKFEFPATADTARDAGARKLRIPAGSYGEATLLTGVFAPVTGEALPIHARLDAALVGPNRTRVPIAGAFLVGRVQGDPNGSRAIVQFHKLAWARPDGRTVEVATNADVADADGTLGLSGTYVWRAGEILALAGLSGAASGSAEAFSARPLVDALNPFGQGSPAGSGQLLQAGGFQGAAKGFEKISEILTGRLEEIKPSVYVPNGKKATVLFLDGVTLDTVAMDEVDHVQDRSPFDGLDFDR